MSTPAGDHPTEIPLTQAALLLGRRYHATLDLIFTGRLKGRKHPLTGRWLVEAASVQVLRNTRAAEACH